MIAATLTFKACRVCFKTFLPRQPLQVVCGLTCARRVPIIARKATRKRLDELRPLSYWTKQAQVAFNAWIRHRDRDLPCISCGRFHAGKMNAGHYLSTGARPELRFDEFNVHGQCEPCNTHLAGNLILYRAELVRRIGLAALERLEGPHPPLRHRAEDLKAITAEYRKRLP